MARLVYLGRLLEVAANVDDLCPTFGWKKATHDLDACGLPLGHDDVCYEDINMDVGPEDAFQPFEACCLDDCVGTALRILLLDEGPEKGDAAPVVVEDDDGGHAMPFRVDVRGVSADIYSTANVNYRDVTTECVGKLPEAA